MHSFMRGTSRRRRGAMLPLIAILLPMLLIFLGFAVDLAYMQATRMELQAAADAAARAGATKLSQTNNSTAAQEFALTIAQQNQVAGTALDLRPSDVEIGRSNPNSEGRWVFTPGGTPANSVRITAPRNVGSRGGPVPLFFGSLIGTSSFQPVANATASFLNVDICLVLDRSSSMKEGVTEDGAMYTSDPRFCRAPNATSRWRGLDGAVRIFLDELARTDAEEQVALVTYSSDLSGYKPALCGASSQAATVDRALGKNLTEITSAMDALLTTVWNGNTHIEAGMRTGLAALLDARYSRSNAEKVMILLTDGRENVGSAMAAAPDIAAAKVIVHTITFADTADQTTMSAVAQACGGQHFHASNEATLRQVFRDLAAQTARLTE